MQNRDNRTTYLISILEGLRQCSRKYYVNGAMLYRYKWLFPLLDVNTAFLSKSWWNQLFATCQLWHQTLTTHHTDQVTLTLVSWFLHSSSVKWRGGHLLESWCASYIRKQSIQGSVRVQLPSPPHLVTAPTSWSPTSVLLLSNLTLVVMHTSARKWKLTEMCSDRK